MSHSQQIYFVRHLCYNGGMSGQKDIYDQLHEAVIELRQARPELFRRTTPLPFDPATIARTITTGGLATSCVFVSVNCLDGSNIFYTDCSVVA